MWFYKLAFEVSFFSNRTNGCMVNGADTPQVTHLVAVVAFYVFPNLVHSITSSATRRAFSDACSSIGSKADSNPRSAMP